MAYFSTATRSTARLGTEQQHPSLHSIAQLSNAQHSIAQHGTAQLHTATRTSSVRQTESTLPDASSEYLSSAYNRSHQPGFEGLWGQDGRGVGGGGGG